MLTLCCCKKFAAVMRTCCLSAELVVTPRLSLECHMSNWQWDSSGDRLIKIRWKSVTWQTLNCDVHLFSKQKWTPRLVALWILSHSIICLRRAAVKTPAAGPGQKCRWWYYKNCTVRELRITESTDYTLKREDFYVPEGTVSWFLIKTFDIRVM